MTSNEDVPQACPGSESEKAGQADPCAGCPSRQACLDKSKEKDTPESCPGANSEQAGKADACAGCPMAGKCASKGPQAPDPDLPIIAERMKAIKKKIIVLSGKGGVGKSTVSTQLGFYLSLKNSTGILDIDICGPSIPLTTGVQGEEIHETTLGWQPVYVNDSLGVISIGFLLGNTDDPVIWRGPRKNGMIKQFLKDVFWDDMDYLVIDTPPGTSDEHLSIADFLKTELDGALIVTTPQEVALADVRKEINFCSKVGIPILGVVENMSGFVCGNCAAVHDIFKATSGGAAKMCEEMKVPFLGRLPLDATLTEAIDSGAPWEALSGAEDTPGIVAFKAVVAKVRDALGPLA